MPRTPGRSWLVLAVAAYGQFGFSTFILGIGAAAPLLQRHFDLSLSQTGVVLAASNVGPVLCLIVWGVLNDRWGERWALTAGLTGAALALAALSTTSSYPALSLLVLLASGLGSTANVSTGRAVMSAFQPPMRGFALGLRQTASPLGGAVAGFALPGLAAGFGVLGVFRLLAVLIATGAVTAALWLRRRTPAGRWHTPVEAPTGYGDRRVWRLAIASGVLLAPQAVFIGLTAVMLTDGRGLTPLVAGALMGALQLIGAVLRVFFGYWSERWGQPVRTLRWICLAVAAGTVALGLCFDAPVAVMVTVVLVSGSVAMCWNSVSIGLVAEYGGEARSGYALGLHTTMLFVAASVAVPLFTVLVEAASWRVAFLTLSFAPAAAWVLLRRLPA